MKEKSTNMKVENTRVHTNNRMQMKQNNFSVKYGNKKIEWINHMGKELQELKEGLEADIHLGSLRASLKKVPNRKTPGHDGIRGFWFKKFMSIHNRLVFQLSRCFEETNIPE